ncbi:hypothetical protein ACCAA_420028 [Candidatus Accumulibacter aalborgensis]|uniref:Uncharacterized protein n=1 Tax=Candidatus Accumulibacter aalborgensis TaxID=1860102 RepID=A0A1A8XRK4_9PROT|nr:hypothetical protein ACCAA_420028 [Candidatus Accumulibacter aalborgensis]
MALLGDKRQMAGLGVSNKVVAAFPKVTDRKGVHGLDPENAQQTIAHFFVAKATARWRSGRRRSAPSTRPWPRR